MHVYSVPGDTYVVLPDEGAELPDDEAQALIARGLVTTSPAAEPEPTTPEPAPTESED